MHAKLDGEQGRPRCQITYDVQTASGTRKVELPFVVGVLADLSGQSEQALPPLRERKFLQIDRDNFNDVLEKTLQDFEPARITPVQTEALPSARSLSGGRSLLTCFPPLRADALDGTSPVQRTRKRLQDPVVSHKS